MPQITEGLRSVLSLPSVYKFLQNIVGANKARDKFINNFVKPVRGQRVLDVGCGTGDIVEHLPSVEYCGFDLSSEYVEAARNRYGHRATFRCQNVNSISLSGMPKFDIVIAMSLLHHLDDEEAAKLFSVVREASSGGGKFWTIDPCLVDPQPLIARYLIRNDRGQNVRTAEQYSDIAKSAFRSVNIYIRHDLLRIPYTHIIMECSS
jgi:SAM-dependent methyltransferase